MLDLLLSHFLFFEKPRHGLRLNNQIPMLCGMIFLKIFFTFFLHLGRLHDERERP